MVKKATTAQQYVLLPARGLQAEGAQLSFFTDMAAHRTASPALFGTVGLPRPKIRVLDSIHEDKAKLVEMTEADVLSLRTQQPGVRIAPVVYYRTAVAPRPKVLKKSGPAAAAVTAAKVKLRFIS